MKLRGISYQIACGERRNGCDEDEEAYCVASMRPKLSPCRGRKKIRKGENGK